MNADKERKGNGARESYGQGIRMVFGVWFYRRSSAFIGGCF
jgi:hypothetical protein